MNDTTSKPAPAQGNSARQNKARFSAALDDTLPPHDAESERDALACVTIADNAEELLDQLSERDFYDQRHRTIFRALLSLQADNQQRLDTPTLYQQLKDQGELENAGGLDYVQRLPDKVPSALNFSTYLATVRDRAARRDLLAESARLENRARNLTVPVELNGRGALLAERAFKADVEPPPLRTVFALKGTTICTPGNLITITSPIKTGKSAVIGAMAGSTIPHGDDADFFGFASSNPNGKAVFWFDTEQSPDDFSICVHRALRRAGCEHPPTWFHAYWLLGLSYNVAFDCIRDAVKTHGPDHGGIHSVFLDGVGDLVADVNDAAECNAFVASLHSIAIANDCPVVCVLHHNPGTEKSRGHLGSQLERKAETNLILKKEIDETTVIYSTKNRRAAIPENFGPRFKYSTEAGMHVSIPSRESAKEMIEAADLRELAEEIFAAHPSMTYCGLQVAVKDKLTVSMKTAQRRVDRMRDLAVIVKSVAGLYVITTPSMT